ncbi:MULTISPECIES: TetR/AcrR family transcriptional regulator [unclassified Microbacterium]|uniref:TetR/AcrR family transcriptional regulator n=1 Tax=unclassified Microbacterium TaxID=2609290 RepID=UPI00214BFF87|nr:MULTISPECIES: TetR/AcrR family transcriptional regulator [unclassified Microbacterium]MCR2811017.1 TetR/AcrR family transcriptional regulator [Microbacterium sp. zg.B185]WIM19586.1 TetR/AcrR family transcriptional regulator [Microbacterium sp. zg-B185]
MVDSHRSPSDDVPLGLRERRRQVTRRELADAALDLFERNGVHGTTADDIAAAAGVSARTFFRYAETKENVIFLDDDGFDELVTRVRHDVDGGTPVIAAIERAQRDLLEAFDDEHPDQHERVLRVRRLVISEPALLAIALAIDAEHVRQLAQIVLEANGSDSELEARILVTALGTAHRLAFDEWVRRTENGEQASTRALYAEILDGLRNYFSATPTE